MIIFVFLGIVASIFQLAVLREFTFSIAKNELSFIVAVGMWLISGAIGSIWAAKKKLNSFPLALCAFLAFSLSISAIHLAKSIISIKYYEAVSLFFAILSSAVFILPIGFILGLAFSKFVNDHLAKGKTDKNSYSKFFAFEAVGFFIGGAIFTFFLSDYSNPFIFSVLPLLLLVNPESLGKKIIHIAAIILLSLIPFLSFDSILKQEFSGAEILANLGSEYGPIISVRKAGVDTLFSAGSVIATSEDKAGAEEFIHMSLFATAVEKKKDILFIGAGVSSELEEIAKHNIRIIDCVEINPIISQLAANSLAKGLRTKVNFIIDDPRLYLKKTTKRYDAVLMSQPAPFNLSLNRFFTQEFFAQVSSRLEKDGIFSFFIPSKREILSPQFVKFNSSILNSLDKAFKQKFIIPSDSMIVIASNEKNMNTKDLLANFKRARLKTEFFTIYNFEDYLDEGARQYVQNSLDKKVEANTDLNPTGFLNFLLLEQLKFYPDLKLDLPAGRRLSQILLFAILAVILVFGLLFKKPAAILDIAVVGFSSITLSSVIFILFQQYCGALFWKAGLLIGLFMLGLSLGTFILNSIISKLKKPLNFSLGLYLLWTIVPLGLYLNLAKISRAYYDDSLFLLYSIICGIITGAGYPIFIEVLLERNFRKEKISALIYSADLFGAFAGTLIASIILIPMLGITNSILALIFLNFCISLRNLVP